MGAAARLFPLAPYSGSRQVLVMGQEQGEGASSEISDRRPLIPTSPRVRGEGKAESISHLPPTERGSRHVVLATKNRSQPAQRPALHRAAQRRREGPRQPQRGQARADGRVAGRAGRG